MEQFGLLFLDGKEIRQVTSELFEIELQEMGVTANAKGREGLLSLWRLSLDVPVAEEEHSAWILGEILAALEVSLRFANDLYYYWRYNDRISVDDRKRYPELRNRVVKKARELYGENPSKLIEVLDPSIPYSVFEFAGVFSEVKEGGTGFRTDEWKWFALVLADAAEENAELLIPQIVQWVFRSDMGSGTKYLYRFEHELATSLFENRLLGVMELVAEDREYTAFDRKAVEKMTFAKSAARKWLQEQSPSTMV